MNRAIPVRLAILESKETRYDEPRTVSIVAARQDFWFEMLHLTLFRLLFRGLLVFQESKERYVEPLQCFPTSSCLCCYCQEFDELQAAASVKCIQVNVGGRKSPSR